MAEANQPSKVLCEIRAAVEADRPGILKCLSEAFAPYRQQYTPDAFADTVLNDDTLRARMQKMQVMVAIANGEVIGTIAGASRDAASGHLRGLAILPQYQGTGVAARLLESMEAHLRTIGCTCVTLNTTHPLLAAMKFYEKHGYSRSGQVSDFFGMPLIGYLKDLSDFR